jgi:hypothetical protein
VVSSTHGAARKRVDQSDIELLLGPDFVVRNPSTLWNEIIKSDPDQVRITSNGPGEVGENPTETGRRVSSWKSHAHALVQFVMIL